jgi:hypothetical protein
MYGLFKLVYTKAWYNKGKLMQWRQIQTRKSTNECWDVQEVTRGPDLRFRGGSYILLYDNHAPPPDHLWVIPTQHPSSTPQTSRQTTNTRYSSHDTLQPHFSPSPFSFSENRAKLSVLELRDNLILPHISQRYAKSNERRPNMHALQQPTPKEVSALSTVNNCWSA